MNWNGTVLAVTFGCALFAGMGTSVAQSAVDNGEYLAIRHCMDCHEIGPGHASLKVVKNAPAFAGIANDPDKGNEAYLKKVLGAGSHNLMVEHAGGVLDKNQVTSIIRYIMSLKN